MSDSSCEKVTLKGTASPKKRLLHYDIVLRTNQGFPYNRDVGRSGFIKTEFSEEETKKKIIDNLKKKKISFKHVTVTEMKEVVKS